MKINSKLYFNTYSFIDIIDMFPKVSFIRGFSHFYRAKNICGNFLIRSHLKSKNHKTEAFSLGCCTKNKSTLVLVLCCRIFVCWLLEMKTFPYLLLRIFGISVNSLPFAHTVANIQMFLNAR